MIMLINFHVYIFHVVVFLIICIISNRYCLKRLFEQARTKTGRGEMWSSKKQVLIHNNPVALTDWRQKTSCEMQMELRSWLQKNWTKPKPQTRHSLLFGVSLCCMLQSAGIIIYLYNNAAARKRRLLGVPRALSRNQQPAHYCNLRGLKK
jgi:hypothetical protein